MTKKSKISPEEEALFRAAMRGVKPMAPPTKVTPTPILPKPQRVKPLPETEGNFAFSDHENLEPVSSDELLQYASSGVAHKMLRKLRQGQYNVDAVLDLHGQTVESARESLSHFLARCQQNGWRHVLVIHGKGRGSTKPILKNKINHWLRQTDQVLAFCSATPRDGSSGALYVLLRRA